jgi:hypothetical protein
MPYIHTNSLSFYYLRHPARSSLSRASISLARGGIWITDVLMIPKAKEDINAEGSTE